MKKLNYLAAAALAATTLFTSCSDEVETVTPNDVPEDVMSMVSAAGFSLDNLLPTEGGYLVEGDIFLTKSQLADLGRGDLVPTVEQYRTNNLVNAGGGRVITMYAQEGGRTGYSAGMIAGLDEAIARYNALNLTISFQRVSNSNNADITMTRLNKRDERQGVLGSAGFPTASGDPYNEIKMSGVLESSYNLSTAGIATIIAHEMGHCIGFRHTDFFDRSISCGGSTSNEGDGGVGANNIPGTPTGADLTGNGSWMLACTDGSSRPFTNYDLTALDYLY